MGRAHSLRQKAWEKCTGVCYLCGLPMFPDADPSSPLAFTLEHIIPKSREGTNDLENLSGSHQWCNNFKSNCLMDEMPAGYRKILRWKIKNLILNMKV